MSSKRFLAFVIPLSATRLVYFVALRVVLPCTTPLHFQPFNMATAAEIAAELAAALRAATAPTSPTSALPKRGGKHFLHGAFLGGSSIDSDYRLTDPQSFRFTSQLQHVKSLAEGEKGLFAAKLSTSVMKFHGNLEATASTTSQ